MWKLIDTLGSARNPPERFKVMEAMHGFNARQAEEADKFRGYSMALQYHQWRTFHGVTGDRVKLYMKRSPDAKVGEIKLLTEKKQQARKDANTNKKMDKNNMAGENPSNLSKLKKLYRNNESARKLLDYLGARKNNMNQTTVDRLVSALSNDGVTRGQVIGALKELAKLLYGEFKNGRKGQQSRMLWRFGTVSLGQAASGKGMIVKEILPDCEEDEVEPQGLSDPGPSFMSVAYPLRVDLVTEFSLPKNLTQKEANRLADFIRTLPFGENSTEAA